MASNEPRFTWSGNLPPDLRTPLTFCAPERLSKVSTRSRLQLESPPPFGVVRGRSRDHNEPPPEFLSHKPVTEEQIVLLIGSGRPGEQDAGVKALYALMAAPVLRFFVHLGVPAEEARDLLQETFVKIFRAAHKFKAGGSAKAWFWQIARNCLNDHLRETARLRKHETAFDDEQWSYVRDTVAAKAQSSVCSVDECVAQGVARFGASMPDRAFALTLQMEGAAIQDIAERIGRTVGATKEYLSQSRKKLQPFIAHCAELLVQETS